MRDLLLTIKRLHFWVLCPLVVLLAAVAWLLGVRSISSQAASSRNEINTLYQTANTLKTKPIHANSEVVAGMDQLIGKRRDEVAKAWTAKYLQQTAADTGVLVWPAELGEDFIKKVRDLHPIEQKVDCPPQQNLELIMSLRRRYQEHIAKELPKLAATIGAKWFRDKPDPSQQPMPGEGGERRGGGGQDIPFGTEGSGESIANQSKVDWRDASQQEILLQHFTWQDGMGMPGGIAPLPTGEAGRPPNLLEILYAQEDLWILQAIMNVIAKTNEGATARFNASIKEIEFIRMGRSAVASSGRIERLAGATSMLPGEQMGGEVPPDIVTEREPGSREPALDPLGGEGIGLPGEQAVSVPDPANGRYVDKDYKSLDAATLRQVMRDAATADPTMAYLAVAKRIPIRLRIRIDQTKLEKFLVECANAKLTIEVRQLRINPSDNGSMSMDVYSMGPIGGSPEMRGGEGDRRGGQGMQIAQLQDIGPGNPSVPTSNAEAIDAQSRTELTVEVYGIVYFYNPVDHKLLGETDAEGGEVVPPTEQPLAETGV